MGSRSNLIKKSPAERDVNGHNLMQVYLSVHKFHYLICFVTDKHQAHSSFFMDSWRLNYAKIYIITISCCRTQNVFACLSIKSNENILSFIIKIQNTGNQ